MNNANFTADMNKTNLKLNDESLIHRKINEFK